MPPVESLNPDASMKHWIASDLRFFRERAGLSQSQLAAEIESTKQAVSNYEHARTGWNIQDRHALLLDKLFGLPGHFERLLRMSRIREPESFFNAHLGIEATADEISVYDLGVVSGLLQTRDYAEALIRDAGVVTTLEADLQTRMDRQNVLYRRRPPQLWFLLDEAVLHRCVGGSSVMAKQLQHLIEISALPTVSIRVVPHRSGWHAGLSSAFKILETDRAYAYTETTGGGSLISSPDRVRAFQTIFKRIGARALNETDTLALIQNIREEIRDDVA